MNFRPASRWHFAVIALPPLSASFVVLWIANVSANIWVMQCAAIVIALALMAAGSRIQRPAAPHRIAAVILVVSALLIAATVLRQTPGPSRWLSVGPLHLYVAPMVLPAALAALGYIVHSPQRHAAFALGGALTVTALLALQPDASQALAFLVAAGMVLLSHSTKVHRAATIVTLTVMAGLTIWAFTAPDPMRPVPHVEGVFALAFSFSPATGLIVVAGALAMILLLARAAQYATNAGWLAGVASYYLTLFLCSTAGLTPAPLIGYGAGPIIGFGLMAAVVPLFLRPPR
jgi:cell division protein FtsW (lipid II flippase)